MTSPGEITYRACPTGRRYGPEGCWIDGGPECVESLIHPCGLDTRTTEQSQADRGSQPNPACGCPMKSKCPYCQCCTNCLGCHCNED